MAGSVSVKQGTALVIAGLLAVFIGWGAPRLLAFVGLAEDRLSDFRIVQFAPFEPQHGDIVIAAVTEATLAAYPYRQPLDRGFLAGLIQTLDQKGARAIVLDVLFDQATESAKDAALFKALREARVPIVVAWADAQEGLTQKQQKFLGAFTKDLNIGLPNLVTDTRDGTVRAIFSGATRNGIFVPGMVKAALLALGVEAPENSEQRLAYRAPPDAKKTPFKVFPAHVVKVLPAPWIKDKIVLIGSHLSFEDRHRTPLVTAKGEVGRLPGIEIHAHALAQLLDGRLAPGWPPIAEIGWLALLGLLGLVLAVLDVALWVKGIGGLAVLAAYWGAGFAGYAFGGPLMPLISPTLSFMAASVFAGAYVSQDQRRQKRFIRQAFARYTSPEVVKALVASPEKLTVSGERREITSLFTDLAGFTSMMEKYEPDVILPILNDYLDAMCKIAFDHGGTVDKIVGDALHVMFNAPLDQIDHPQRAARCALEMDLFARTFVAEQKMRGLTFGGTRIGANTGWAVVGNFGGETFFDYTAHGDTINTAARLESVNKQLGTMICIAASTASRCSGIAFRPSGTLVLKGKTQGISTFEPLDADVAASEPIRRYMEAFALMEEEDAGARKAFDALVADYPDDRLAHFHVARLASGETGALVVLKEK